MKALIQELVAKADLSEDQANKAAAVVRGFLVEKLPPSLHGPIETVLTGERLDDAVDLAKNLVGGLFK